MMASSFKMVEAANLVTVGEMLDSLCEPVGWGPLVELTVRSSCFIGISTSKPIYVMSWIVKKTNLK